MLNGIFWVLNSGAPWRDVPERYGPWKTMCGLLGQGLRPRTLGADRGYDSGPCMIELESRGVVPHTAMRAGQVASAKGTGLLHRKNRPKVEARRRMRPRQPSPEFRLSQRARKKMEEGFTWWKTIAGIARTRLVGGGGTLEDQSAGHDCQLRVQSPPYGEVAPNLNLTQDHTCSPTTPATRIGHQ